MLEMHNMPILPSLESADLYSSKALWTFHWVCLHCMKQMNCRFTVRTSLVLPKPAVSVVLLSDLLLFPRQVG